MGIKGTRQRNTKILDSVDAILELAKKENLCDLNCKRLDVYGLANKLGLSVLECDMLSEQSGYLKQENGRWVIGVNKKHHPKRKRFTIAHELGHFIKHRKSSQSFDDTTFFRKQNDASIEYDANNFAAELLMPRDLFLQEIRSGNNTIEGLADTFDVSSMAVKYRAKTLGLSGHGL